MSFEFPILTSPFDKKLDFLEKFREIVSSDFKKLIIVSPFVDVFIIENIVKKCVFKKRKLLIITRYKRAMERQRKEMQKASQRIFDYERRDPEIKDKIEWIVNERLHAKFIIKDWELILFGSQNLIKAGGLTGNYELGAIVIDEKTVKKVKPFVDILILTAKKRPIYPK